MKALLLWMLLAAGCVVALKPDTRVVEGRAKHRRVIAIIRAADNDMASALGQAFVNDVQARVVVFTLDREKSTKALALGVRAENADLVFAIGADALAFAQRRLKDLPVLFAMVAAPEDKIVRREQVAGVGLDLEPSSEFALYRVLMPKMRKVLLFHGKETKGDKLARVRKSLAGIGIALTAVESKGPKAIGAQFDSTVGTVDAVWLASDPSILNTQTFAVLRNRALASGKPLLCSALEHFVRDGALMAVTPDVANVASQVGLMAAEILSGRRTPAELGVVAPVGGGLVVNSATATKIGLPINDEVRFLIRTFYEGTPTVVNATPLAAEGG
jgi:putative tryptophan/tyrosine transport system substrate-binding protein